MYIRIKKFPVFMLVPFRCVHEVLEGFMDILCLFKRISKKAYSCIYSAEAVLMAVQSYGRLDIVNVDVKSPDAVVKVKILLR